jgi:hypothetical protein
LEEENIEHTGEDVTDICRDIVGECFSEWVVRSKK